MGNICKKESKGSKRKENYSTGATNTDRDVETQLKSSDSLNEIKNANDGMSLDNTFQRHEDRDNKPGKKEKRKHRDQKKEEQGKENKQTKENGATKKQKKGKHKDQKNEEQGKETTQTKKNYETNNEHFSNIFGGDSQGQGTIASEAKDSRKPERNDKTNVNSKTAANQDEGHSNEPSSKTDHGGFQGQRLNAVHAKEPGNQHKKDNETKKQKQSTQQIKEQSSKISSNNDKGGSCGQGMHADQSSVSGNERQSSSDKLSSPSQDSKVNQVDESGNSTTKTGTKGGSQQSLTGQKSETSGNVTRISVNKSDSQHSLTSPKVETSSSTVTSQTATTKSADQKPIETNVSVSSGTSERDKKIVLDTGMQTYIKYYTESQYDKEHKEREEAQRRLKEKEEEIKKLIAEKEAALLKITRDRDDLAKIQSEKIKLEKEKDELLTRLSAMAGRKLTDNNPNIADLSDLNRPTKLAEKFSELYDNAWTDAFSVVQEQEVYKENEETAVKVLLDILTIAYKEASKAAEEELSSLKEIIERFQRSSDEKSVKDVMKQLKDSRKKKVQPSEDLKQVFHTAVEQLELDVLLSEKLKEYKDQCLDLCWLMVIQDPPVFLQCEACKEGDKFDKNTYREYTQGGDKVAFAVWPALFLEKGGALLSKGVVQCKKRPLSSSLKIKTGQDLNTVLSKPKSHSVKVQGNKQEVMKAFQTEIGKTDAEKNGNMQPSDERRNSSSQLEEHF